MLIMTTFTFLVVLIAWIPVTHALQSDSPSRPSANILFLIAALYGLGSGTFVSLLTAIIAQLTKDMRTLGTRVGAHYFVISFATLISNPIAGAILDAQNGSYIGLAVFTGVSQVVGTLFILWSRGMVGGWGLAKKL